MPAPAPAPAPTPSMPEPPTGEENPMMNNEMPPMDEPMPGDSMNGSVDMDSNEEGDDKKKEIQKLAGELSELLHTYNEENGEDEELNKYVKGMIDAQTDGKEDSEDDDEMNMDSDENMEADDMEMEEPQEKPDEKMPKMEGRKLTKKQLREEFADLNQKDKFKELRVDKKRSQKNVKPNNPFTPPKFN